MKTPAGTDRVLTSEERLACELVAVHECHSAAQLEAARLRQRVADLEVEKGADRTAELRRVYSLPQRFQYATVDGVCVLREP